MPWIDSSSGKSGMGEGRVMVGAGASSRGAGWVLTGRPGALGLLDFGGVKVFLILVKAFENMFCLCVTSGACSVAVATGVDTWLGLAGLICIG